MVSVVRNPNGRVSKCPIISKKPFHRSTSFNGPHNEGKEKFPKTSPDISDSSYTCFVPKKKKLPLLPSSLVQNRITLEYFLFLTDPIVSCTPPDLPFKQSIKEQIFVAQTQCNALFTGNKFRRSTCCNLKFRKLEKKIDRLNKYFLYSDMAIRPYGRKVRKIISKSIRGLNQSSRPDFKNTLPKRKNQINHSVYVSRRKRRKSRIFKRIHSGPICASKGLLAQLDAPTDPTSNADSNYKDSTQSVKLDINPVSNLASEPNKYRQTPVVQSRWIVLSKSKACFVPANLAIFDYKEAKMSKHVYSVLGFKCLEGKYRLGWARKYSKQMDPPTSIRQLSIKLGEYFAYKKLGIDSPKPLIPAGYKVIRVKAQKSIQANEAYSMWKKKRNTLNKPCPGVFCGAGPKKINNTSKGSVADFFVPLNRFLTSMTDANSLVQCNLLNQTDKESVIAVAKAMASDAFTITLEMDTMVNALNSLTQGYNPIIRKKFGHSNLFMTHLIKLCGCVHFPEVKGMVYPIDVNRVQESKESLNIPCVIEVNDYGTTLFHTATSSKRFENLWPILTALSAYIIGKDSKGNILIKGEAGRSQIRHLLTEPFRCFFIALGKVTNYNPICLMEAFRTQAINRIKEDPGCIAFGSPLRQPILSVLEYGAYVEDSILDIIFPDIISPFRIIVYANVGSKLSARSYESGTFTCTKVGTLFLQDSEHYTVMYNNSSLAGVPVTKHKLFKLVPQTSYDLYPIHPVQNGVHVESLSGELPSPPIQSPDANDSLQVPKVLHESMIIKSLDSKAWYSYSLARYFVSLFPGNKFKQLINSHDLHKPLGIASSRLGCARPFPSNIDLGYSLLNIPQLGLQEVSLGDLHPDIKELAIKMLSRKNRCLVIHIAAVLRIHPLTLEADLIEAALRLLSCSDCHKEKILVLMALLSQEKEVDADIFKLIFPQHLKGATIRIIKVQDKEPYTQAVAYEDSTCIEQKKEVNLLLHNGHFSILTDSSFMNNTTFKHHDKSLNNKLSEPICQQFSVRRYSRHKDPINTALQSNDRDMHSSPQEVNSPHIDAIPCKCGNSSFTIVLNVLKCTSCKSVREYVILSTDDSSSISDVERTFEDEDELEDYSTNGTNKLPNIVMLETAARNEILEKIVSFFQYYFQKEKQIVMPPLRASVHECRRNIRAIPKHGTPPITEGQLFESDDYDILLKFDQEIFMFKVILFSAACSPQILTDSGWRNNQYLLAPLYKDPDQPFTFVVLSHRNLHELPSSLSNVLKTFHETFVIPRCTMHDSSDFTSKVVSLRDEIQRIILSIPNIPNCTSNSWPVSDRRWFTVPRHPKGKWEAWESPGTQIFRMHSKSQWVQYILALNYSDILASSVSQYLQFCSIFNYIPNITDMISYRIYGELYCALQGGFIGEFKPRILGSSLASIVDEINLLRRIKYYDPMSRTSAKHLLGVLIKSQWWSDWEDHDGKMRLSSVTRGINTHKMSNNIFDKIPQCIHATINSFLTPMDACKVNWTFNPVVEIGMNSIISGLNSMCPIRIQLAASKLDLLAKAQCILYAAEKWLPHKDILNILKAAVQCTSIRNKCFQNTNEDIYRPLLSSLPFCEATKYVKIQCSTNKIVARFRSDFDLDDSTYDLTEFKWQNFKDGEDKSFHIEFVQGFPWTICSWPHCIENHHEVYCENPSTPSIVNTGYRLVHGTDPRDAYNEDKSWVASKNNIFMKKVPLSWILSHVEEGKKTSQENINMISSLSTVTEKDDPPPDHSFDQEENYIMSASTLEEFPSTPDTYEQSAISYNSAPLHSTLSSTLTTLTMSPNIVNPSSGRIFSNLILPKDISWVKIVRDYLTTIEETLDKRIKNISDIYQDLRGESGEKGVCHSQCCSFKRHGNDMGFMVHTLCTETTCNNFNTCVNNIHALESTVQDNLIVMKDPKIGPNENGLFSGNTGFSTGDFICTYGGTVKRGDKIGKKQNRFLMQLGTTYLIDGQDSDSYGKFINHGCSASANARTQFIVTQTSVLLGIVAIKEIPPGEQIFMDYCGVVPQRKINPTLTGVILNCTCNSCSLSFLSNRKTPKPRKSINLSKATAEEWMKVGRCPDIGILGMNNSSSDHSSLQDSTQSEQQPSEQDDKSAWTSLVSLEKCSPPPQTPPSKPRWKQQSYKSPNRGLTTFRDLERSSSAIKPKRLTKFTPAHDIDYDISNNVNDSCILIRFMDLLTPGSARKIPSTHIRGVYHLVICFEIVQPKTLNADMVILSPVHFKARCNPIKVGSSLLIGAISSLNTNEVILKEGTLTKLAHELLIPDIGDMVFQWLRQTSLFKDSKEDKVPRIIRNYNTFPKNMNIKTTPSKAQENRNSPASDYSSVSSLSASTINESSLKLMRLLKKSNPERHEKIPNSIAGDPEIQEYIQQSIQRKLDQFLKDINIPNCDGESKGIFCGRGPKRTRKRKQVTQTSNAEHHNPAKDVYCESSLMAHNASTSPQPSSPTLCSHYIQWSNTCLDPLLCNECPNTIPQIQYCCHSMCGRNSIICAKCFQRVIIKYQNHCVPQEPLGFAGYPYQCPYQTYSTRRNIPISAPDCLPVRDNCNSNYGSNSPTVSEIQFSPAPGPSPCSSPDCELQSLREDVEKEIEELKKSRKEYENYWENQYQINESTNEAQEYYSTVEQFKGRGPNNVQEDNTHEVSRTSQKHDNIDTVSRGTIENTVSRLPLRDSTDKFDKSPEGSTHSTARIFTGAGKPQDTEIRLSVEANYIHHTIAYTVKRVRHEKRELVFTINGIDNCKCSSIRASEKRIIQTRKLFNAFVNSPAFVNDDEFSINAKVHQMGYALYISNRTPMVSSFRTDKSQKADEVTLLGNHIIWNGDDFTWKNFLERLGKMSPKHVFEDTPPVTNQAPTRKFASPSNDGLIDVFDIFNERQIQYIKDFNMDNIGKYRINTIPNIMRKDAAIYQRILASVLKGSCDAIEENDEEKKLVYSRLIYLVPPLLLRKPKGSVTRRMEAFIAGDLEYCVRGMLATRDNYYAPQRSTKSTFKAAADKVFNGQYAKAVSILTQEDVVASPQEIKEALITKHPPRCAEDNNIIMKLPTSIPTPDVTEEEVYTTAMRPTKRGVAPGPNGDRAEFLQTALFNPFESSGASTVIKYLTKHINLERQGKLSEEWYVFTSSSNLIAITKKLRPIGMGYSGRKLVSGVSLLATAKAIRKKFTPFQQSSLIRNGPESVVHLIRRLHQTHGNTNVFLQIDVKNAFNSVSRLLASSALLNTSLSCIHTF